MPRLGSVDNRFVNTWSLQAATIRTAPTAVFFSVAVAALLSFGLLFTAMTTMDLPLGPLGLEEGGAKFSPNTVATDGAMTPIVDTTRVQEEAAMESERDRE